MEKCLFHKVGVPVLQNQTYPSLQSALNVDRGEICLTVDELGVLHNRAFDSTKIVYGLGYDNSQQSSKTFRRHLEDVADLCASRFVGMQVYEVGAGDGSFLDRLNARGVAARGCDPASDGRHPAIDAGSYVEYANQNVEALVLRHVVEHIPSPREFLRDLKRCFPGANLIYVEVPNLNWIIDERAWFDVTYEHVNYFTPSVLSGVLGGSSDCREMFNGQFIGVFGDIGSSLNYQVSDRGEISRICSEVLRLQSAQVSAVDSMHSFVGRHGLPIAIWGMAGKGAMLLETIESSGVQVSKLLDINEKKWNMYSTRGKQILPGETMLHEEPHLVIVSNPVYLNEVRQLAGVHHSFATLGRNGFVVS